MAVNPVEKKFNKKFLLVKIRKITLAKLTKLEVKRKRYIKWKQHKPEHGTENLVISFSFFR